MLRIYEEAKGFGYCPNYFRGMVVEWSGLSAAKHLLGGNQLSDGFVRLWEEQRLDLSVEALALREPWSVLFTQEELTGVQRRLNGAKYDWRGSCPNTGPRQPSSSVRSTSRRHSVAYSNESVGGGNYDLA